MINDELLNKFDEINELPVSEEMLGAFLEGNLNLEEMESIGNVINENNDLSSITSDLIFDESSNNFHDSSTSCIDYNTDSNFDKNLDDEHYLSQELLLSDETLENNNLDIINNEDPILDDLLDDSSFELPDISLF